MFVASLHKHSASARISRITTIETRRAALLAQMCHITKLLNTSFS